MMLCPRIVGSDIVSNPNRALFRPSRASTFAGHSGPGPRAGYEHEYHLWVSRRQLPLYRKRQIECQASILGFIHADRARTKAEEARVEAPKHVRTLKMEHVPLDYRIELGVSHSEGDARHGNHLIKRW
jgi:hypothetical protein